MATPLQFIIYQIHPHRESFQKGDANVLSTWKHPNVLSTWKHRLFADEGVEAGSLTVGWVVALMVRSSAS